MSDRNRLIYLPLGGAGEIGMNCYVYGYGDQGAERLIVVDTGVAFPDMDGQPGVDLILPDIDWLAERADRIEGIFITHAHEDHVGALGHLWSRLRAPVYRAHLHRHPSPAARWKRRGRTPSRCAWSNPIPQ
jgi:ribonuclease J